MVSRVAAAAVLLAFIPASFSIPFIVLHGINNPCSDGNVDSFKSLLANQSGAPGFCIEVGNGEKDSWQMPLFKQVDFVCDKVKQMSELSQGYNIVAQSQGNLVARGVIEWCEGGPPVRNYVSLGGPHAGVASVPNCKSKLICALAAQLVMFGAYNDFAQEHIAPSNYFKIPNNLKEYQRHCKFLPRLNNEHPDQRDPALKARLTSLHNLVLIMFEDDTVLVPKETAWFGFYPDGHFSPALPPQQTKLYKEDWIGLKTLDEAGKVKFVSVAGKHVEISDEDAIKYIVPFLKDPNHLQH